MDQIARAWFSACLVLFSLSASHSGDADTISSGRPLSGGQTIVSKGGIFELGFFRPGNTQNFYIGIWYKYISIRTVVWVANRDKPVSSISTSELKISNDGNLVLAQSQILVWSSNLTLPVSSFTEAVLLDSGNLILRNGTNSPRVLWQSFDHPTDTWLPTQRFSLNRITGESHRLISWRNREDPSPGIFANGLDPDGLYQVFLWRNVTKYWSSGLWTGNAFADVAGMAKNNYQTYQLVSNEREIYYAYTIIHNSTFSRIEMDVTGIIKVQIWLDESQEWLAVCLLPNDPCSIPSLCGGFSSCNVQTLPYCSCLPGFTPASENDWSLDDWRGGCVRISPLQCSSGDSLDSEKDSFLIISNVRLPGNSQYLEVTSIDDCELACLNNCSCTAYSYNDLCMVWSDALLDLKQLPGSSSNDDKSGVLHLRLAASGVSNADAKRQQSSLLDVVGTCAGFVGLFILVSALCWKYRAKNPMGSSKVIDGSLVMYQYSDLSKATNNFSDILGHGGFGTVFKGTLSDSTPIAVKKLKGRDQGEKQFRAEVSTIGLIRHVNLISLHGFCSKGSERLLVYDYMPNGSLSSQLFKNKFKVMGWSTRYQIAIGAARGLAYLHENCRDLIIHCDVKPDNILLDEDFSPKVADFGLAKLVGREFSTVLTTMRGTLGYLAPEWISGSAITPKADVYSYGMMLLEIISGRRNITQSDQDESYHFFPTWAAGKIEEDDVLSLLDCKLEGEANIDELQRACRVSLWCIQDDEKQRPTMGSVVQILEGLLDVDIPPTPRILQSLVADQGSYWSYSSLSCIV